MKNLKEQLYNYQEKPPANSWNSIVSHLDNKPIQAFNYWKGAAVTLLLLNLLWITKYVSDSTTEQDSSGKNNTTILKNKNTETEIENNTTSPYEKTTNLEKVDGFNSRIIKSGTTANEKNNSEIVPKYIIQSKSRKQDFSEAYYLNKIKEIENQLRILKNEKNNTFGFSQNNTLSTDNEISSNNLHPIDYQFNNEKYDTTIEPFAINLPEIELNKKEEIEISTPKKWSVSAFYSPTNINTNSRRSAFLPEINSSKSEFANTNNFGVKTSYRLNNKLFLRTGFEYLSFEQQTSDIGMTMISQENTGNVKSNITYNGIMQLKNASQLNSNIDLSSAKFRPIDALGVLNQQISYSIIPIELGLKIINRNKFNTNVIVGGSMFFLTQNKILFKNDYFNQDIGSANNLNKLSYSAQLGLDFNYLLYKNLELSVQPTFRYFINTFSTNLDTKPYTLGVNAGINFKF